jgi:hypothetical protein
VDTKANEFRRNAEDCRQRALHAHNSCDRQHWVDVAAHWTKMALAEEMANCPLSERPDSKRPNSVAGISPLWPLAPSTASLPVQPQPS